MIRAIVLVVLLAFFLFGTVQGFTATTGGIDSRPAAIIDGRAASSEEIYATVALVDRLDDALFCTGTLISDDLVLTAAHCVVTQDEETGEIVGETAPSEIYVAAGVLDATSVPTEMQYSLREIVPHPDFPGFAPVEDESGLSQYNDLALLFLSEPVEGLTPVTVLSMDQFEANVSEGTSLILSGYGGRDLEGELFGQLYMAETPFVRSGNYEFIAGAEGSPDTCPGDSGGPAYLAVEGSLYLVGTTSRAMDDATQDCGEGGLYTLDTAYIDWIAETVALNVTDVSEVNTTAGEGGCNLIRTVP